MTTFPRPIRCLLLGSLSLTAGAALAAGTPGGSGAKSGAAAAGETVFKTASPPCASCHSLQPGVAQLGPSLAGVATRAEKIVKSPDYKGKAKDARGYLHESIVDPNAYIVPGKGFAAGGNSMMPNTFTKSLTPQQIDQLVDYLMTLK